MTLVLEILAAWIAFAALHSLTASRRYKSFLEGRIGHRRFERYHALLYTVLSLATFALLAKQLASLPDRPLYSVPPPVRYLFRAVQLLSVAFLLKTPLDAAAFLGIRQAFGIPRRPGTPPEGAPPRLLTSGTYGIVRHPLYLGFAGVLLFQPDQTVVSAVSAVAVVAYFYFGSFHEESRLLAEFGDAYREYRRAVPRILPFRFRRRK